VILREETGREKRREWSGKGNAGMGEEGRK